MTRTITLARVRNIALLGIAGLGTAGAIAAGPATAATAAAPAPANPVTAPAATGQVGQYDGALQPNGYYCGPAATRIAVSAHENAPSFDSLAGELGTTRDGTRSIDEITRVLNAHTGEGRYTSVKLDGESVSPEQTQTMRTDVTAAVNDGDVVVVNIVGQVTDTDGETHRYAGGHYVTITGYTDEGNAVRVTDPADRKGSNEYQLSIDDLAGWTATRGYTS